MIGHFYGDEVYGADGRYLGELKHGDRLVTDLAKKELCRLPFSPARSACIAPATAQPPLPLEPGYETHAESLQRRYPFSLLSDPPEGRTQRASCPSA